MSIRNASWYGLNGTRPWPVDDTATLRDDNGLWLPHHVLVDANIRFPSSVAKFAYVGSVSVTDALVSLTILGSPFSPAYPASNPPASTTVGFVPLAVVTLKRPVDIFRHYALEPLASGVGGWVVFGPGIQEPYIGRFSTPGQALLTPRIARQYKDVPVAGLGVEGRTGLLDGLVSLKSGNDLEIVAETREIDGVVRDVIVFRLKDTTGQESSRNVFDVYKGPCGANPDSGNCGDPQPIEFLGAVGPDCCGNVTIELRGCAEIASVQGTCGVVIDCDLGVVDACISPDRLPKDGKLPSTQPDYCELESSIFSSETIEESSSLGGDVSSLSSSSSSSSSLCADGLPWCETFTDEVAQNFEVIAGAFEFVDDDPPDPLCE